MNRDFRRTLKAAPQTVWDQLIVNPRNVFPQIAKINEEKNGRRITIRGPEEDRDVVLQNIDSDEPYSFSAQLYTDAFMLGGISLRLLERDESTEMIFSIHDLNTQSIVNRYSDALGPLGALVTTDVVEQQIADQIDGELNRVVARLGGNASEAN